MAVVAAKNYGFLWRNGELSPLSSRSRTRLVAISCADVALRLLALMITGFYSRYPCRRERTPPLKSHASIGTTFTTDVLA